MIKAHRVYGADLPEPDYFGYAVDFSDGFRGALAPLSNEIVVRKWLADNGMETVIKVQPHRVVFSEEGDAVICYLAFK